MQGHCGATWNYEDEPDGGLLVITPFSDIRGPNLLEVRGKGAAAGEDTQLAFDSGDEAANASRSFGDSEICETSFTECCCISVMTSVDVFYRLSASISISSDAFSWPNGVNQSASFSLGAVFKGANKHFV